MSKTYKPRGMPARFMEGAPAIVRRQVADIIAIKPAAPLEFDVVMKDPADGQIVGLDFGKSGERGCHFFLEPHEARAYRERNRRKRTTWADLPDATRAAIIAYLEEPA